MQRPSSAEGPSDKTRRPEPGAELPQPHGGLHGVTSPMLSQWQGYL